MEMKRIISVGAFLIIVLPFMIVSSGETNQERHKVYICKKTDIPPEIDGILNDTCWKKVAKVSNFTVVWAPEGIFPAKEQTIASVCYDDRNLYVGMECLESNIDELKVSVNSRDGTVYLDDCVEVFLDPTAGKGPYFHFILNAKNAQYDEKGTSPNWDGNWKSATTIGKKSWFAEISIPFETLDCKPLEGNLWRVNLNREHYAGGFKEYSCWSNTIGSFHTPTLFGRLIFGSYTTHLLEKVSSFEKELKYQFKEPEYKDKLKVIEEDLIKIKQKCKEPLSTNKIINLEERFNDINTEYRKVRTLYKTKIEPSLISYFPLNEGEGRILYDLSKSGGHGEIYGATWYRDILELDGTDDYIMVPHRQDLNLEGEFTITAWVNPASIKGRGAIVGKGHTFHSGYVFFNFSGKLGLSLKKETSLIKDEPYEIVSSQVVLEPGRWSHIAVSYSIKNNKASLYHNGEKIEEGVADGKVSYPVFYWLGPEYFLTIGVSNYGFSDRSPFEGFIREVKIYGRALSDSEIEKSYLETSHIKQLGVKTRQERRKEQLTSTIEAQVLDSATGKELNARVHIKGSDGEYCYPEESFAYGMGGGKVYFFSFGGFHARVPPGKTEITVLHGFEYEPEHIIIEAKDGKVHNLKIRLRRFIDMASRGWYCGEDEIQYRGHGFKTYDEKLGFINACKICEAEGLNWAHFTNYANIETDKFSDPANRFIAQAGVEPGTHFSGDMIVINAIPSSEDPNSEFSLLPLIESVEAQGGAVVFADSGDSGSISDIDRYDVCRELPVLVALDKIHLWHRAFADGMTDTYRYLNLGFKFSAAIGTDTYMNDSMWTVLPGCERSYVKLGELSFPEIVKAYREQKIVYTTGPLLLMTVNDKDVGETIFLSGKAPEKLNISLEADSAYGIKQAEIIKNGEVIKVLLPEGGSLKNDFQLEVDETCWIAARVYSSEKGEFLGDFAHTSPVYIQFGDDKIEPKKEDIEYFLKWLDTLREILPEFAKKARGYEPDDPKVIYMHQLIDRAKSVYKSLPEKPRDWKE